MLLYLAIDVLQIFFFFFLAAISRGGQIGSLCPIALIMNHLHRLEHCSNYFEEKLSSENLEGKFK